MSLDFNGQDKSKEIKHAIHFVRTTKQNEASQMV